MRASHASYWRRSSSSRWIAAALLDGPLGILLPLLHQHTDCFGAQRLRLAYLSSGQDDARTVLQTLHPNPGLIERPPHGHGTVIGEQQRIVLVEKWDDLVAQVRRARCPIRNERDRSHHENKLRQQIGRNLLARNGKASSGRRGRQPPRPPSGPGPGGLVV